LYSALWLDKSSDLALCPVETSDNGCITEKSEGKSILDSIVGNGFVWGVPDHRRTIERRRSRRLTPIFLIKPKKNIITCNVCGHYHEAHTICGNCYEKVKLETKAMQDAIQNSLKLDPVEQEVVVLYENENKKEDSYEGKRIVELDKPSPPWFTRNLLTRTNEQNLLQTSESSKLPASNSSVLKE